ncbi:ABC transporter ATP-binding protein [Bacillus sp. USDA818B3_A]|uniref:ABC transporter ATP-binding protein n=1 Tax=Bacillus sp. USDA818B3_A TaxID=2698834 RepID=UPI00136A2E27|nr:ABC transporter ATP-binding protein [Bacillus sp. USDA818B3_A]
MRGQIFLNIKQYFSFRDLRRTYSLLSPYIIKYWFAYLVLLITVFVETFITIGMAKFYGNITETAVHGKFDKILTLIPIGILLIAIGMISRFAYTYFNTIATNGVKKELKNHLFKHILRLSPGYVSNLRSGELISHFTNDINGVDGLLGNSIVNFIKLPITYIFIFIYLMQINWVLCLMSVLIAPLAALSGMIFGLILRNNSKQIHQLIGKVNNLLTETFQGFGVIRSFTMEKDQYQKYRDANQELYQLELKNTKLQGWYATGGQLLGTITFIGSLSIGALFVSKDTMTVGALLTFVNLVGHLVSPLTGLAGQWAGFQRSIAAVERVLDLLDKPAAIKKLPFFSPSMDLKESIQFQNMTFGYEKNKNVFEDFSLEIPAGKVVALVGPSGAGKSTLFNLILKFYRPQSGDILIDQNSIDVINPAKLRSAIAYVPQDIFLFAGTIRENLLIARPNLTETEMVEATINANIHDFIMSLPHKYETEIGERGVKLSGGQKQRLAIARAILKNAPILLLDEATSALDGESEYHVKNALDHLMENRTTIVIAHRLSTIQNADLILVMDKGRIVQKGSHEELLNQEGLYKNLTRTKFDKKKSRKLSLVNY